MIAYSNECSSHLPSDLFDEDVKYDLGPAFACLLCATFLKPMEIFVNLLTPVVLKDEALREKLVFEQQNQESFEFNLG